MSTTEDRGERCGTCRFWLSASSECHRHAPFVIPTLALAGCREADHGPTERPTTRTWPTTVADDWCGDWAPADAPKAALQTTSPDSVATRLFLGRVAPNLDTSNPALLESLLDQLPADARRVLVRMNGLDGRPPAGVRSVARELKISQGHVRALIETAEEHLAEVVRLLTPVER